MAIPKNREQREFDKFVDDGAGNPAVRVIGSTGGGTAGTAISDGGYSTTSRDFTVTPTVGTKDVVVSGLSFSLDSCSVIAGGSKVIDSSGNASNLPVTNVVVAGNTITFTDKTDNFATGDVVCLSLGGPDKAYNSASDSDRVEEINPLSQQFVIETFTLTNVPNATPDETIIIDMDGFTGLAVHFEKTGGADTFALTMESSVEGVLSTVDFIDTTQFGFTSATAANAASYAADGILYANPDFNPRSHKVKITTAGGANDADFNVFIKKLY